MSEILHELSVRKKTWNPDVVGLRAETFLQRPLLQYTEEMDGVSRTVADVLTTGVTY